MTIQRQGGFLISKIHQLSGRIFARILKKYNIQDINPARGRILFVLWEQDHIPIIELSEKTQLGKSTLTAMLDRLENEGFVERVPSKEDRRKILIRQTEKARSLQNTYTAVSHEMTSLFYRGFKEQEVDEIENYLKRILDNLINQ